MLANLRSDCPDCDSRTGSVPAFGPGRIAAEVHSWTATVALTLLRGGLLRISDNRSSLEGNVENVRRARVSNRAKCPQRQVVREQSPGIIGRQFDRGHDVAWVIRKSPTIWTCQQVPSGRYAALDRDGERIPRISPYALQTKWICPLTFPPPAGHLAMQLAVG